MGTFFFQYICFLDPCESFPEAGCEEPRKYTAGQGFRETQDAVYRASSNYRHTQRDKCHPLRSEKYPRE